MQFDAEEFFRVGAEILQQLVQFARGPGGRIVQGWIYHQLPDSALSGIHFVDSDIDVDKAAES